MRRLWSGLVVSGHACHKIWDVAKIRLTGGAGTVEGTAYSTMPRGEHKVVYVACSAPEFIVTKSFPTMLFEMYII